MRKGLTMALSLIMISAVFAATASPNLQITVEQTNMDPGETGYLKILVSNTGLGTAYNTRITMNGLSAPLSSDTLCNSCSLYSNTQNTCLEYISSCYYNMGDVNPDSVKTYIIPVIIPNNVSAGYYSASFQLRYDPSSESENSNYLDYIELISISNSVNNNPDLIVSNIIMPERVINPGEEFELTLNILNSGSGNAENVKIMINSESFNTIGTANSLRLNDLLGGQSENVTFRLESDDSTSTGLKTVSFTIECSNNNEEFTSTGSFGIRIGGEYTDFEIYIQDVSTTSSGTTVSVKIANVGLIDASSVSLELESIGSTSTTNYVGDLTSGSYAKTSFNIQDTSYNMSAVFGNRTRPERMPEEVPNDRTMMNISNSSPGMRNLVFVVSYTNQLGERVRKTIMSEVNINSGTTGITGFALSSQLNQDSASTNNITMIISWFFIGGIVVVIAYFFIKSRRRAK